MDKKDNTFERLNLSENRAFKKENEFKSKKKVSENISENLEYIKKVFSVEKNFDFVIREFKVNLSGELKGGFLIFYDGLVKADYINRDILNPLMTESSTSHLSVEDTVYSRLITQAPLDKNDVFDDIIEAVGFGNCAIFIDTAKCAFIADVKGWSGRGVGKPITEAVLSGPQEAFNEKIMTNIGLIRKILKNPDLIAEKISIGNISKTPCSLMYINGLTNPNLVSEVRKRLLGISLDYVFSSADIEMMTEDSAANPLPQIIKTERPDRAASHLADGKVVVIVQGSPFVLIMPGAFADLIEASEDSYVRVAEANYMRIIRILGLFLALFLPASFNAAALYHHEALPTELLFAIEASREEMPFPFTLELIIMIFSFELIKEASIRIPDPIGSTLGIVGGLILGQAAVSAGIASPILIIIVSIAALGAFAVPSLSLSRAVSTLQLFFILLSAIGGFFGIALGVYTGLIFLSSQSSFGIPYLSQTVPSKWGIWQNLLTIKPIWKRELRPESLNPEKTRKQPHISRKWKEKTGKNTKGDE